MALERIGSSRDRTIDDSRDDTVQSRSPERTREPELDPSRLSLSPTRGKDLAAFVQNAKAKGGVDKPQTSNAPQPRGDDRIMFVGMNGGDQKEAPVLGSAAILAKHEAFVSEAGRTYDLSDLADTKRYLQTLGLPPAQAERIASIISSSEAKGELASIARAWAPAETGRGDVPARLVLSGHSGGNTLYGKDSHGHLWFHEIRSLARQMPKAAALVEGIHFSACSSGIHLQRERSEWTSAFSGLKTMWGYDGECPLSPSGHVAAWARATQRDRSTLDSQFAVDTTAVWSRTGGFVTNAKYAANYPSAVSRFDDWASGRRDPSVPSDRALLEPDRRSMRWASGHESLPAHEAAAAHRRADFLIRLERYPEFAKALMKEHHGVLVAGYAAVGLRPPSFDTLTRRQALTKIAEFQVAAGRSESPDAQRCAMVLARFAALDRKLVQVHTAE